jgi:hypothetical protein
VPLAVLCLVWGESVPLFSAPDEHAHLIRGAGLVRGEVLGTDKQLGQPPNALVVSAVRLPHVFSHAESVFLCYVHQPRIDARCAPAFSDPVRSDTEVLTAARRYPPLYYLVALPTLVEPNAFGVHLTRALSGLVAAALLASGLAAALSSRRPVALAAGGLVAITPMVLYLGGVVNPNGLEAVAAFCAWMAAAAIAVDGPEEASGADIRRLAVGASLLVLARGLSPLWLVLVLAAAAVLLGWDGVRRVWRRRSFRVALAVIGAATVAAALWLLLAGPLSVSGQPSALPQTVIWRAVVGRAGGFAEQMVGSFGFLDAPAPSGVMVLWAAAAAAVCFRGVAWGSRRTVLTVGGLVAATVVLPMVLEAREVPSIGFFRLGRYTIPLAMGIPIAAAVGWPVGDRSSRRVLGAVVALTGVSQVAAYAWVVRRYAVGSDGRLDYLLGAHWGPSVPLAVLLATFAVAAGALAAIVLWTAGERRVAG